MNLLDHPEVREYFASDAIDVPFDIGTQAMIALRILQSMQELIEKGDLLLAREGDTWVEVRSDRDINDPWHPHDLRLPDRFQTKDEVEEKIQYIRRWGDTTIPGICKHGPIIEEQLRELVALERKKWTTK